jgi:hypothetical protein
MAASADSRLFVRHVTDVHASWSVHGESEPGQFSFQLILDDGAVEQIVFPDPQAAKVALRLLRAAGTAYIDTERGAISFSRLAPGH